MEEREGLSDPAPASEAYLESLARVYADKLSHGVAEAPEGAEDDNEAAADAEQRADLAAIRESDAFARFVEAQLTWDRAMAEALAEALDDHPQALAVGVLGRGHIEHRHGVPHQLADLGISDVAVLIPMEAEAACQGLAADFADAVFLIDSLDAADAPPARPRLGVMIETGSGGVTVLEVIADSVAEASGLLAGDVIVSAAGVPTGTNAELIEVVQRQAPGTWLPLEIERDGEALDLIAKFPVTFE